MLNAMMGNEKIKTLGTCSNRAQFVSCCSSYIQVNVQRLEIAIFSVCLNVTFSENWQNLRTQLCSSKAVNTNMSLMCQTEVNFLLRKIELRKLWKVYFLSAGGHEVQKFTNQQNSEHRHRQNFSNIFQGYVHIFEIYIV